MTRKSRRVRAMKRVLKAHGSPVPKRKGCLASLLLVWFQ